jgi:hypothetical protein
MGACIRSGPVVYSDAHSHYSYPASKAALNMTMWPLSFRLREDGIIVVCMDPGWVPTDMGGARVGLAPQISVSGLLHVVDGLTLQDTGRFLRYDGSEVRGRDRAAGGYVVVLVASQDTRCRDLSRATLCSALRQMRWSSDRLFVGRRSKKDAARASHSLRGLTPGAACSHTGASQKDLHHPSRRGGQQSSEGVSRVRCQALSPTSWGVNVAVRATDRQARDVRSGQRPLHAATRHPATHC